MQVSLFARSAASNLWRFAALSTLGLALAACGGGGDSSSTTPTEASADGVVDSGGTTKPAPTAPGTKSVTLEWSANAEADLAGYRVYYGSRSGSYLQAKGNGVDSGRVTSYTVNGLTPGTTYYIAITAYDVAGNESGYSAEVAALVQ